METACLSEKQERESVFSLAYLSSLHVQFSADSQLTQLLSHFPRPFILLFSCCDHSLELFGSFFFFQIKCSSCDLNCQIKTREFSSAVNNLPWFSKSIVQVLICQALSAFYPGRRGLEVLEMHRWFSESSSHGGPGDTGKALLH